MSLIGTNVGRIRLVDRLGKGGMGEVFVGFDEILDRRVAVKCVRVGGRRSAKIKGRFLQEARILSRLEHPNICQIYDFVEGDERDYLVMELVEGRSLKQAMAEGLDDRAKLRIAQQVADVLVAAHAEGVVHRDLKPEHVLIDGDGEVKVLDFGIAYSMGFDEDVTVDFSTPTATPLPYRSVAASVVGTPRYMSPEQARGEPVTPASDMYTFGLLLQETFSGEPPYDSQPIGKLLSTVAEGRSRPVVGLPRPLTELVERLEQLNPSQRPSAKETSDRIRWIRDTPKRWLRRGLAVAALLLVMAGVAKYLLDLRRERTAAVAARNQAEGLVTFMLEDLSRELRPVGKLDALEQVARKALEYYEQASPEAVGEPAFRRGRAFYSVAEVLDDQGDIEAAIEASSTALALHRWLVEQSPDRPDWRNGLALDHLQLGILHYQQGERGLARDSLWAARDLAAGLVELDPGRVEWRRTLGEAHYSLGLVDLFVDEVKAEDGFLQALAIYRQLAEEDPSELFYTYRLAVLHGQGLGQIYSRLGRADESLEAISTAYELQQRLVSADPSNSRWQHGFAWENRRLGFHLEGEGRLDEALERFRQARSITERLLSLEPSQVVWQVALAVDHRAIGSVLESRGELGEALAAYRQALEIDLRLTATEPSNAEYQEWLATDYLAIGWVLARLGRSREAEESWEVAIARFAPLVRDFEDSDRFTLAGYAHALLLLGRVEEARPAVGWLRGAGWFDGQADAELVALCRQHGLLPEDPVKTPRR